MSETCEILEIGQKVKYKVGRGWGDGVIVAVVGIKAVEMYEIETDKGERVYRSPQYVKKA